MPRHVMSCKQLSTAESKPKKPEMLKFVTHFTICETLNYPNAVWEILNITVTNLRITKTRRFIYLIMFPKLYCESKDTAGFPVTHILVIKENYIFRASVFITYIHIEFSLVELCIFIISVTTTF